MSKIFISHSSRDNAKALAVAQWLDQNGWADYFLDIAPAQGMAPGERWQEALRRHADRCQVVLFLISPAWRDSKWCELEFGLAKLLGKLILGAIIEPTPLATLPKDMTGELQLCDLTLGANRQVFKVKDDGLRAEVEVSYGESGLVRLKQGLLKAGLDPVVFPWPPPNEPNRMPYRGLKALEAEDAAVFFGREASLIRALDTLRRMEKSGEQLLVILGASGVGKSSFLRAGLWPRLKRDDLRYLPLPVVRPERAAISGQSGLVESLENTFREYKAPKTRAELRETLAKSEGIVELVAEVQTLARNRLDSEAAPPTIVISVDQAEELFGNEGGQEAEHLLHLLGRLVGRDSRDRSSALNEAPCSERAANPVASDGEGQVKAPQVMVLAAIRSDSYERLQTTSALTGIRQTPFSLPPLAPAEYKMVIEGPAARATAAERKLTIEPALTEQLLQDAEGADALPLLAFILQRLLSDYGADGNLLLKEYEALGGLQGSIEAAVKEAWKDPGRDPVIPVDEAVRRALLHQAFPSLVMLDQDAEKPKRRVATWSLLPTETHPLLERLVAARLLLKDRRKLADGQETVVVELAHEALIRHWSQLKSWVDANREFLAWQQQLNATVKRWERNQQRVGLLLRGLPLCEAEQWFRKNPDRFSVDERRFVTASRHRRTRERVVTALSLGMVLWLLGGMTWLWQKGYHLGQAAIKIQSLFATVHVSPQMVKILGGTFQQGDVEGLGGSWRNPVRLVAVKSFAIGQYEVTFEEYDRFAIATGMPLPSDEGWGRGRRPVINVSWDDARAYAEWLSRTTGQPYRLPTEFEWEYAARSGTKQEAWAGTSDANQLVDYAVLFANSAKRSGEVGTKKANEFGLFDMSGNVWEWVEDCAHDSYQGAPKDGSAWLEADGGHCGRHVHRGGSWGSEVETLRTSNRDWVNTVFRNNGLGFRLVRSIP